MNKTVTINLSGIVFHIDEDAFEMLKIYLEKIRSYFSQNESKDEIMRDIEYRIAEIFQSKINDRNQVIIIADIDEVIAILGKPEDFGETSEEATENKSSEGASTKRRRLFRDTENSVLGGVCSGLGHYFNVDPVWFRLAFVLALFIFSSGILIYIILWIIIPRATTITEKYEMKGEKVNIPDIEKNVKEEMDRLKQRLGELKKDAKGKSKEEFEQIKQKLNDLKRQAKQSWEFGGERFRKGSPLSNEAKSGVSKLVDLLGTIFYYFAKATAIFIGIILLAVGLALVFALIVSFTGSNNFFMVTKWGVSSISIPALGTYFFNSSLEASLATVGILLAIGIPVLMLVLNGIRLIFGFRRRIRIVAYTAFSLWLAGVIISGFVVFSVVKDFREKGLSKQEIPIVTPKSNTIYISMLAKSNQKELFEESENSLRIRNWHITSQNDSSFNIGLPKLKILKNDSNYFAMTIVKSAKGESYKTARHRAENIVYTAAQKDTLLVLDNYFSLSKDEKWRDQQVTVSIYVPLGKYIYLSKNLENLLYYSDYNDESWDADMIAKPMVMTESGLKIYSSK